MTATVVVVRSSGKAVIYYERDAYYARNDPEHRQASFWYGDAAKALGLRAHVHPSRFEAVLSGYVPGTDLRLGRMREGQHEHRPGWDITLSAPKSVSLEALVMGDRRVIRAHDEAVRATLDFVEAELLQTRGWDPATRRRPRVSANGMVVAGFRHLASRDQDPQLHTHCVLANMTRTASGEWRSVEPTKIRRSQKLIGAFYRNELARRLQALGMAVAPRMVGPVPGFELAGYERSFIDAFSGRRRAILEYLEQKELPYTAENTQMAALHTRRRKEDRTLADLVPEWRARAQALGLVRERMALRPPRPLDPLTGEQVRVPRVPAPDLPANEIRSQKRAPALPRLPRDGVAEGAEARLTGAGFRAPAELSLKPERGVLEAVARAVAHVAERRTAVPEAEIRAVALGHAPGRYTLAEVDAAIARLVRDGELIEVERRGMDRAFVTDRAVKAERRVLASMRAGCGKGMALANGEMVEKRLEPSRLTRGQREAVRTVLLSNDLVIGVQGHAGSGKTTMLSEVKELLGERKIQGLAPSAVAARVLAREAGIPTRTLQYFLTRFGDLSDPERLARARAEYGGAVLAVDEASMTGSVRMEALLRVARALKVARVVLVGDTKQLKAVDAGQPFRLLQKAGMATATMKEVKRQRDPELRAAVGLAREGEPGAAIAELGNRVREAPPEELGLEAGRRWLALAPEHRADTLILAPTHAICRQANDTVREGLAEEGAVEGPHTRRRPPGQPAAHPGAGFRHPELRARRHRRVPSRRLRLPRERRLHRHGPRRRQGRAGPSGRRTPLPALGQCVALSGPLRHRADRVARRRPDPLDAQPQGTPRPRQPSPGAGPGQWRRGGDRGDRTQAGALPRRRAGVQYRAHRPAAAPSRSRVLLDRAFCTGPDGAGGDRRAGRRRLGRPRAVPCRAQPGLRGVPAADRRPGGADRAPGGARLERGRGAGGAGDRPFRAPRGGPRRVCGAGGGLAGTSAGGRGDEHPSLLPQRATGT